MSFLIDRHKQEVFGEDVHVASPRFYPLMPHVTIAGETSREDGLDLSMFTPELMFYKVFVFVFQRLKCFKKISDNEKIQTCRLHRDAFLSVHEILSLLKVFKEKEVMKCC